jgi:hypothetical protein
MAAVSSIAVRCKTCRKPELIRIDSAALRPDIWFKPSEVWEIRGAE